MKKHNVTVKAVYYEDMEVEGCDVDEAYRNAMREFKPCADNLFSIDVLGLSPWDGGDDGDPHSYDKYRQAEIDES